MGLYLVKSKEGVLVVERRVAFVSHSLFILLLILLLLGIRVSSTNRYSVLTLIRPRTEVTPGFHRPLSRLFRISGCAITKVSYLRTRGGVIVRRPVLYMIPRLDLR